jgi:hypothetical protein
VQVCGNRAAISAVQYKSVVTAAVSAVQCKCVVTEVAVSAVQSKSVVIELQLVQSSTIL